VSEIEQIINSALEALSQAQHLSLRDKARICGDLENLCFEAAMRFREADEEAMDRDWTATCVRLGMTP